ncbi:hypothetical protein IQ255_30965 [Pleurocapsales cyanobacterium LEGE 10410]|nr:hypothetical protein [Pleurocapsales cyanobacterium LEGE 10410]
MNLKDIPWPNLSHDLLKLGDDWTNFAQLDFPADREVIYSEGYKEAANLIASHLQADRMKIDLLIYPLVFLYRHHVELSLKSIIISGNKLLDRQNQNLHHHKIDVLWIEVKDIITEIWSDHSDDIDAVENIISQLASIDPGSFSFRYHEDKIGNSTISALKSLDINNFKIVMDSLSNFLGGVSDAISDYLDTNENFSP